MEVSYTATEISAKYGDNSLEYANQLFKDAQICRSPWSLEEADSLLHKVIDIYNTVGGDKTRESAKVYEELGDLYFLWETVYPGSKLEEARDAFVKAGELYKALGDYQEFYNSQENLALTHRNDLKEFRKRFTRIIEERKEKFGKDDIYLGRTYLRLAGVFRAHNDEFQYEQHFKKYREILNKNKEGKTPKNFEISCYNEVINQCMTRIMDDAEAKRGIEALQNINKLLDSSMEVREIVENKISIAMLRTQMEQYETSIKVAKEVLTLAQNSEITRGSLLEVYRLLFHAYTELGEGQQAETIQSVLTKLEKESKFWIQNFNRSS